MKIKIESFLVLYRMVDKYTCDVCETEIYNTNCSIERHERTITHLANLNKSYEGSVYCYYHEDKCYIGSSSEIEVRKSKHENRCFNTSESNKINYNTSFYKYIRDNNLTFKDLHFEVLETFMVTSEEELHGHEQNYIDIFKENDYIVLNYKAAHQTIEEKKNKEKNYHSSWRKENRETINAKTREWSKNVKQYKQCPICKYHVLQTSPKDMKNHQKTKYCQKYQDKVKKTDKYAHCVKCNSLVEKDKYKMNRHQETSHCKNYQVYIKQ
jgi:hypothetical protein